MNENCILLAEAAGYHLNQDKTEYKDINGFFNPISNFQDDLNLLVETFESLSTKLEDEDSLEYYTYIKMIGQATWISTCKLGVFGDLVVLATDIKNKNL